MRSEYGEADDHGSPGDEITRGHQLDPGLAQDIEALLEEVGRLFPVPMSLDDAAWKVAGAACLARCRELLWGALAAYQVGAGGVAAVLYRSLYEFWLWGHYLLVGEDEAASLLLEEREWHVGRMTFGNDKLAAEGVPVGEREVTPDDEPVSWKSVKPNLREVALRVADLRGIEYRGVVLAVHESSWRRASFVAAHPSWAALKPYALREENAGYVSVGQSAEPWAAAEYDAITHSCAALVIDLSEQVVEHLCLPKSDGLDRVHRSLARYRY